MEPLTLEKQIEKLEVELVMSGYHDGWTSEWIKEQLEHLKSKLQGKT